MTQWTSTQGWAQLGKKNLLIQLISTLDIMATISQMIFSNAFWRVKSFLFWFKFYWYLFRRVQLTTNRSLEGPLPCEQGSRSLTSKWAWCCTSTCQDNSNELDLRYVHACAERTRAENWLQHKSLHAFTHAWSQSGSKNRSATNGSNTHFPRPLWNRALQTICVLKKWQIHSAYVWTYLR